jgi:hypothetical protein
LISDGTDAQEIRIAEQNLPGLHAPFHLATQVGAQLGACDLLLCALS